MYCGQKKRLKYLSIKVQVKKSPSIYTYVSPELRSALGSPKSVIALQLIVTNLILI